MASSLLHLNVFGAYNTFRQYEKLPHGRGWKSGRGKRVAPSEKFFCRIRIASLEGYLSPVTIPLNLEDTADTISHPHRNPRKQRNFSNNSNQLGTDQSVWTPAEGNKSLWSTLSPAYKGDFSIPMLQTKNRNWGLEVHISKVTNRRKVEPESEPIKEWKEEIPETVKEKWHMIFEKSSTWKHIF